MPLEPKSKETLDESTRTWLRLSPNRRRIADHTDNEPEEHAPEEIGNNRMGGRVGGDKLPRRSRAIRSKEAGKAEDGHGTLCRGGFLRRRGALRYCAGAAHWEEERGAGGG